MPQGPSLQALSPSEIRSRLFRPPGLAVITNALQTAAEKGLLKEEKRERHAIGIRAAVRTRGAASGSEPVYRLVPAKMAAALCHGLLTGAVLPSAEVSQLLLDLMKILGAPQEILEAFQQA